MHFPYLQALSERVLIFDGAMGTQVMALELGPQDFGGPTLLGCNEALVLYRPDIIEQIHLSYLEAGAVYIGNALSEAVFRQPHA